MKGDRGLESEMMKDPVCGMMVDEERASFRSEYEGRRFYFCCKSCKEAFDKDPKKFARRL